MWYNWGMLAHLPSKPDREKSPLAVVANTPLPSSPRVTLQFDGSCNPNPGPMRVGYLLSSKNRDQTRVHVRVGAAVGQGTNNEAEYHALLAGMRHALRLGLWNMTAYTDSLLVNNQMNDVWKVKKGRLAQLHREAQNLSRLFARFNIDYVPREYNTDADELSRMNLFQEPEIVPPPRTDTGRFPRALPDWQAAAIRVWWLNHHPGAGTLSRVFGVPMGAIEQIGYGTSYRDADFSGHAIQMNHLFPEDSHVQA